MIVQIESEPAPVAAARTATPGSREPGAPPQPELPFRILLVEDCADNRKLLSVLLRSAGADVTLAENGRGAVEKTLGTADPDVKAGVLEPFDLILMDMQMPVMDGYEATRWLRRHGYKEPIVAITAHALAGDRERCLAAGCNGYAAKPIDRKRLIQIVKSHARTPAPSVG